MVPNDVPSPPESDELTELTAQLWKARAVAVEDILANIDKYIEELYENQTMELLRMLEALRNELHAAIEEVRRLQGKEETRLAGADTWGKWMESNFTLRKHEK